MTGPIPPDLGMGVAIVFDISHNQFSGTVPGKKSGLGISTLVVSILTSSPLLVPEPPENFATEIVPNVRHVHMDHNIFSGSIPDTFRELGHGRLRQLYLNDCQFSGKFPENWLFPKFLNNIDLSNNRFKNNLDAMCLMSVFENGELVELRADCPICNCDRLCRTCRDNEDFKYEYDDDDWVFDDDSV
jgi:hypothetical protein